jgi:hypothetical protein
VFAQCELAKQHRETNQQIGVMRLSSSFVVSLAAIFSPSAATRLIFRDNLLHRGHHTLTWPRVYVTFGKALNITA